MREGPLCLTHRVGRLAVVGRPPDPGHVHVDARGVELVRLVERCLDADAGWQVMIKTSPLARPLVEEVVRALGRRGAYPIVRLSWAGENWPFAYAWAEEAPADAVARQPSLEATLGREIDAWIAIGAKEIL